MVVWLCCENKGIERVFSQESSEGGKSKWQSKRTFSSEIVEGEEMRFPPCPHCGAEEGVYRKAQARGSAELQYDSSGNFVETYSDRVWFKGSDTIRCAACGKIRPSLRIEGKLVVVAE
ncbi:MAG: hypothetical protein CMF17_09400 [Idiomarinaceae bacterium]|nr:hypothetical protein [Idiomarinaceae bacterium]